MFGLIMLIVMFLVIINFARSVDENLKKKYGGKIASPCPPHKWTYHPVTNRLTCTECNYEAGSDFNPRGSNDKPY
jgi:hypothetical protein